MKKLAKCARCGEHPECLVFPTAQRTARGRVITHFEVACTCGAHTGRSHSKNEAVDDWNAKQECLRYMAKEEE